MDQDVRARLQTEMSHLHRPGLDGLATVSIVERGRRARRHRRRAAGIGSAAVVASVTVAVVLGSQLAPGSSSAPVAGDSSRSAKPVAHLAVIAETAAAKAAKVRAPATLAAAKTPAKARTVGNEPAEVLPGRAFATAPHPDGVPATPQGLAQLFSNLLPAGTTAAHWRQSDEAMSHIEVYLSNSLGVGMVRVLVTSSPTASTSCSTITDVSSCTNDAAGDAVFVSHPLNNCIQATSVGVNRPDGTEVQIDIGSCLEADAGGNNAAGSQVLTPAQAIAIATNPRMDSSMDPDLVAAGAARFPSMPFFR